MKRKPIPNLIIIFMLIISACAKSTSITHEVGSNFAENFELNSNKMYGEIENKPDYSGFSYPVVDSSQEKCFDDAVEIACPEEGGKYYGQDAQYTGIQPSYVNNGDGTVTDVNTGLMWIQDAGEKVEYYPGVDLAEDFEMAGYTDWRLPTIKELYSLMDFSGIDELCTLCAGGSG